MARPSQKGADQALALALACGATVENAARKAGIAERTAYRRLDDPAFRQRVNQLRLELVQRTAGMLSGAGLGSVKTLVDLQNDVAVAAGVRRRAARDVLELGLKLREAADLEERLAAVEERLAQGPCAGAEGGAAGPPTAAREVARQKGTRS
jgi:phenylalanyl-tRNA synthetase beta subunit